MTEEPGGLHTVHGSQEEDTAEQLSTHTHTRYKTKDMDKFPKAWNRTTQMI